MAAPSVVRGSYIDIAIGDGGGPEVFSIICGLTTRSFTGQVNTTDTFVPDCADPEDVPIRRLIMTGKQWSISGEGLYNRTQRSVLEAALGVPTNYRFIMSEPAADNVEDGYYGGLAVMTSLAFTGGSAENGTFATCAITIESDGEWTWTDAA